MHVSLDGFMHLGRGFQSLLVPHSSSWSSSCSHSCLSFQCLPLPLSCLPLSYDLLSSVSCLNKDRTHLLKQRECISDYIYNKMTANSPCHTTTLNCQQFLGEVEPPRSLIHHSAVVLGPIQCGCLGDSLCSPFQEQLSP